MRPIFLESSAFGTKSHELPRKHLCKSQPWGTTRHPGIRQVHLRWWQPPHPGLYEQECSWDDEGGDVSPLFGTCKTTAGHWVQFGAPGTIQTVIDSSVFSGSHQGDWGWSTGHLSRGHGLICSARGRPRGILWSSVTSYWDGVEKVEPDLLREICWKDKRPFGAGGRTALQRSLPTSITVILSHDFMSMERPSCSFGEHGEAENILSHAGLVQHRMQTLNNLEGTSAWVPASWPAAIQGL